MTSSVAPSGSFALLTDLYQLTMADAYFQVGMAEREAVFHLYFRKAPFHGGFAVSCGQQPALKFLREFHLTAEDLNYLRQLTGDGSKALLSPSFLEILAGLHLSVTVDMVREGTVVFPHEPIARVRGPLWQCQLLETPLLNLLGFQTLVATKAARVAIAAGGDPVLEFGLRRAQGVDGGLSASRAAFVGGCSATSNVLAGQRYGIPVKGTHAHSWVMAFGGEQQAFDAWVDAMPHNSVLLVDTYDTTRGVEHAIAAGRRLRARGHHLAGIRLDSGDLAWLSTEARRLLDSAGFRDTQIIASNDLDEHLIQSLKQQGARIDVWGVGTRLSTAFDHPALGAVYKLAALGSDDGSWNYPIKLSEQAVKISTPGLQQILRFSLNDEFVGDAIVNEADGPTSHDAAVTMIDPADPNRQKTFSADVARAPLLVPVFGQGACLAEQETLHDIQSRVRAELARLNNSVKRFENPHSYPVGLEQGLHRLKTTLIRKARGIA